MAGRRDPWQEYIERGDQHPARTWGSQDTEYLEQDSRTSSPPARSRTPSPGPASYGKPCSLRIKLSNRQSPPLDGQRGVSSDNPLYELDDTQLPVPVYDQRIPNNQLNPLYGNDPFNAFQTVCMTEFLRPKGARMPLRQRKPSTEDNSGSQATSRFHSRKTTQGRDGRGRFLPVDKVRRLPKQSRRDEESPDVQSAIGSRNFHQLLDPNYRHKPKSPDLMASSPPRLSLSRGMSMIPDDESSRFSPMSESSSSSKRRIPPPDSIPSERSLPRLQRIPQPSSAINSFRDLVAAVRSDQNLLKAEVRRDGNREPRIPGDHDRYFAPRKGDIIIHFAPTAGDNKLVEYFDERKTMGNLQPGDKLVRVKYDNYKIPDHIMITSKLYIYFPEWVYLGRALQTIKTA